MDPADKQIKILTWNANGIKNKIIEFYDFLINNNIQIACVNETFLKPNITIHASAHYQFHRLDRPDRPKGGIGIIIDRKIKHNLLPFVPTKLLEVLGVEIITTNATKIEIYAVYLPVGSINSQLNQHLEYDLKLLINRRVSFFLLGDFNCRHRFWNCSRANHAGSIMYNFYCNNNFLILNPPTHTHIPSDRNKAPSTIDFIIQKTSLVIKWPP